MGRGHEANGAFPRPFAPIQHARELPAPTMRTLSDFFTYCPTRSLIPLYRWYQSNGSGSLRDTKARSKAVGAASLGARRLTHRRERRA